MRDERPHFTTGLFSGGLSRGGLSRSGLFPSYVFVEEAIDRIAGITRIGHRRAAAYPQEIRQRILERIEEGVTAVLARFTLQIGRQHGEEVRILFLEIFK